MKLNSKALITLIFLALPVCQSLAGIAAYNHWNISEINVCFAEKETEYKLDSMKGNKRDWSQSEKVEVQKVLEEEFTAARTGYTFVGFLDCNDTLNINVVAGVRKGFSLRNLSNRGEGTVGQVGFNVTNRMNAQGAVVFSPMGVDKNTITHEFGHVLGLMHEHEHPDAKAQATSLCNEYKDNSKFFEGLIYTDFDETSIMNYCFLHSPKGRNAGLSLKDQEIILDIFNNKYKFIRGHIYKP